MAGVFPRTQKNSNLKALVENALLPFAHLGLDQQILSDGQGSNAPRRFNQPSYKFQTTKFHAQACSDKLLGTESITDSEGLPEGGNTDSLFEKFKGGLKNKTLQICKYRLCIWTEDQIQCVEQTYPNSKSNILENIRDSPFYIEIEGAEIYNQTDNTLFGNPQSIRTMHLVSHLIGRGAGRLIKNMYILEQGKPIQSRSAASGVVDKTDISATKNPTPDPHTSNSETASINDNQTTINPTELFETSDIAENVVYSPNIDISGDEEGYSDNIDDGNVIPMINASAEGGSGPSREINEGNGQEANVSGNDNEDGTSKERDDEDVDVENISSEGSLDCADTSNRVAFAATQQSQVRDEEDEIEPEEDVTYNQTLDVQEEILSLVGDEIPITPEILHEHIYKYIDECPGDKSNLQRLQEYLEDRLQQRLTAEHLQYADNLLKELTGQEINLSSSPDGVIGDSKSDRSDARTGHLDSINSTGNVPLGEGGKYSESIAIEPANDEIETEEKEEKTTYEVTVPVNVDKLGLKLSVVAQDTNITHTILEVLPTSFLYNLGVVEKGDVIIEIEVDGKYTKEVASNIGNLKELKKPCKLKLQRCKGSLKEGNETAFPEKDTVSLKDQDSYMNEFNTEEGNDIIQIDDAGSQSEIGEIEVEESADALYTHQKQFTQQSQVEFTEEDESVMHTRNAITDESQEPEGIIANEIAGRSKIVNSADTVKACDADPERTNAGPNLTTTITIANEDVDQGGAIMDQKSSVVHVEEDLQVKSTAKKKPELIEPIAKKQSIGFISNFPKAFWRTIEEKIQVLFEKYHTLKRTFKLKKIVRALSHALDVSFTAAQQNRINSIYAALVEEKIKLLPKTAFLNKYENDDDNYVYHIVRGAIWYIPVNDVESLSWNETWEDVTNHSIFNTERFLRFNENYDKNFKRRNEKRKRSRIITTTNISSSSNEGTEKHKRRRNARGKAAPKFVEAVQLVSPETNDARGAKKSCSTQEHEVVFPQGISTLGFSVDTVRVDGKTMLAVSSIREFGYANRNTDLAVGDLLLHVRTMANDFNLEQEDDIDKAKEYIATKKRPVSFTIRRRKPEIIKKKHNGMVSVKQEVSLTSTPSMWIGHQALL